MTGPTIERVRRSRTSWSMRLGFAVLCALLVGGCYSTYTTVDGERCRRYEPLCGLLADDELRCELDDRGCQVCTCQRARSPAGLERNEHDRDAYDPWKR